MLPSKDQILVVDDEANIRRVLSAQLAREGYEVHTAEDGQEALAILREHHIAPKHLEDASPDGSGLIYVPLLVLANKCDGEGCDEVFEIFRELLEADWPMMAVSVESGYNLDVLKAYLFDQLDIVRVYSKMPGKEPDLETPFVMRGKPTLEEFASKIHQDFYTKLKSARVWGSTAFEGQQVQRDYVLRDGDVVELKI